MRWKELNLNNHMFSLHISLMQIVQVKCVNEKDANVSETDFNLKVMNHNRFGDAKVDHI